MLSQKQDFEKKYTEKEKEKHFFEKVFFFFHCIFGVFVFLQKEKSQKNFSEIEKIFSFL